MFSAEVFSSVFQQCFQRRIFAMRSRAVSRASQGKVDLLGPRVRCERGAGSLADSTLETNDAAVSNFHRGGDFPTENQ